MSKKRQPREPLDPWIEGYLDYLRDVRRKAHRTITDIRCTLKRVCRRMSIIRPGTALWKASLEDYLRWLEVEREDGRSTTSMGKEISHIRGLLDYSWRAGRADRNVLDGFRLQDSGTSKPVKALSVDEARRLVVSCEGRDASHRRARAMILLLYGCGLRTSELCQLDIQDVDIERREILIRAGKGDIQRRIPVPSSVWTELLTYLVDRKGKRGPAFRTEVKRRRISDKDVCRVMRQAVERAGLEDDVTAKTLRHSFATHLMDQGVDLSVIASLMGHSSPQATGVYLHVLPGKSEDAVDRLKMDGDIDL